MITRFALALVFLSGAALAGDLPALDYLESSTVPRWGRISVHGSNLDQAGEIHIAGIPALVMPIPGTNAVEMNAYVPDTVPYGTWDVVVTTSVGQSNALSLTVEPNAPEGRKLWRFTMNAQTMLHRPAVGADGTVYAKSAAGDLVALTPDGALAWLHQIGSDWTPAIDVGPDGTVYTADGWPRIHAVNPDGTTKWVFEAPLTQGLVAGPNVGPDGNIYAVDHAPGLGVFSLDADGNLRWSFPVPEYTPIGQQGQEIVFSDTQLFVCQDGNFDSFDFDGDRVFDRSTVTQYDDSSPQPAVGPNGDSYVEWWGRLQSFDPDGNLNWIAFDVGGSYLRDPDVGPDGTIYVMRNVFNTFWALDTDGSEKWSYNHPDTLLNPVVSPAGDRIVIGGSGVGFDPAFFLGMDTDGTPLWQVDLPFENPTPFGTVKVSPQGRARFTPDGSVAYGMAIGEAGSPGYSYLYALQVGPIADAGHGMAGSVGVPRLAGTGTLEGGSLVTMSLTDALPGAPVYIVVGVEAVCAPFKQGVLVPRPDAFVGVTADASGTVAFGGAWFPGVPSNVPTYWQAWVQDPAGPAGWAASNALSLITP